jgi:hypothetical protein
MKNQLLATLTLAGVFAFSRAAIAEQQTIETEGLAAVVNNDIAMARDKAIDDAKRKAVEQVAGSHVSSESITQNFQLVEDKIYARASGFVKTYQIASEFKDQETYHVKIKATVDASAVAENLDQIFKAKPRVIVLIAEQNVGGKAFSYWWGSSGYASEMDVMQTALIEQWQPHGFKFIDPALLRGKLKVQKAMQSPQMSDQDAFTISRSADADIAIVGKVLVSDAGPVMDGVQMHSFHAVGTMRVLNVDTGEIIAVKDESGVAPHIDPNMGGRAAIKALATKLASDLEKQILTKWTAEAASSQELELEVAGAKDTKQLNEIERVLKGEVRGVESATLRRRAKGKAFFTVKVRAESMAFAHDVEAKSYKDFSLAVDDVSKGRIKLHVNTGK